MQHWDVIIIGAGAAGLMCAIEASKRGRRVLILDQAEKVAQKIRISGGGRANFTNIHCTPANFLSDNPRFCISALKRYGPKDFIALVEKHHIAYHEKTLGQLFCDGSAQQIIDMLVSEAEGVRIETAVTVKRVAKAGSGFAVVTDQDNITAAAVVIATGGPSIPKMGSSGFGYQVAKQFGLNVIAPHPGLVPLTFGPDMMTKLDGLSGLSVDATVKLGKVIFAEALLFTHRGLSGPVILQISSYWHESKAITLNLLPGTDAVAFLKDAKNNQPKKEVQTVLSTVLPKNLAQRLISWTDCTGKLAETSDKSLRRLADHINAWRITPSGSEGYRTAEVTVGGVDTKELSSKTMECRSVPGLFFIGEAVDVTGHLGGFNFQWAWASGHACGQAV